MSQQDIIKAWKDEDYRSGLSEEARAALPANPAGLLELTDEALDDLMASGGATGTILKTLITVSINSCLFLSCNTKATVSPNVSDASGTPTTK